jgi:hypothetical protein
MCHTGKLSLSSNSCLFRQNKLQQVSTLVTNSMIVRFIFPSAAGICMTR